MSLHLPAPGKRPRIDASLAIVNIVLLLIFFFLLSGQEPQIRTPLDLSTTTTLAAEDLPSPVLEIRGPEDWLLDSAPIRPEMLPAALASAPGPVHVLMDRAAPAGLLVAVLRRPELAGHELRLVTLRNGGP
ncbi:biopolymer transporter ExbD [Paracoccus kondratievae]|uniref:biopolymer transporter ExbD n=1 Tax=Paracoccus kondratievae TaxID=135740 RepID=UPI0012661E0B|nr:biopolymer transporter ExbD [Paracoccus kondratievae]QFQ88765.1 biopolymer transporter ExbD [Paracoccus kondratievae]